MHQKSNAVRIIHRNYVEHVTPLCSMSGPNSCLWAFANKTRPLTRSSGWHCFILFHVMTIHSLNDFHQSPKLEVHRYEVLGLYHTVPKVVPHLFCFFITFLLLRSSPQRISNAVAIGCQTSQISIYEALQPTFTYQWSTGIFWSSSVRRSMARFLPKARTRPVKIWWLGTTPSFRLHVIFKHLSKPISHI